MSLRRFADVFLGAGLTLGTLAVAGWVLDLVPNLPPAVLKLVIYKLVFIGALGLIGFGALLGRLSHRLEERERHDDERETDEPPALAEPRPLDGVPIPPPQAVRHRLDEER